MRKGERIIKRLFVTISVLCALSLAAMAQTATVTVHLADPSNSNVTSRTFLRVELKNTAGQQCRVAGSGLIVPTVKDVSPDSNGNISTSLIKTSSITCGSSTGNAQWAFTIWRDGKPQPSCFLQVTGNLDLTNAVCLNSTSTPVTVAPTDAIFMRLDAVNSPAQPWTFAGLTDTGTLNVTGAVTANSLSSLGGIAYCDAQSGADIGAKCNAAFATLAGAYGTVRISSPGTYTYTTDMVFSSPVKFECAAGVNLKYTGTGKAAKFGPDGLTAGTYSPNAYVVDGCQWGVTGSSSGASMTHGLYFNKYVVKSVVQNTRFVDFGNTSAFNIFYQSQNWDSSLINVYMWSTATGPCFNGVLLNGYDADNTTADNGNSFLYAFRVHLQPASSCATTGMIIDGIDSVVLESALSNFNPLIRVRRWGSNFQIGGNTHMEVASTAAGACGIQYGDVNTDPSASTGTYINGLTIKNSLINVHNSSFTTTAHPICPAQGSTGLTNAHLDGLTVWDITNGQPVIVQNTNINQFGNRSFNTAYNTTNGIPTGSSFGLATGGSLHTQNGNINAWEGTDETLTSYGGLRVNGVPVSGTNQAIFNNGADQQNNVVIQGGATADQDLNLIFNNHSGANKGRINQDIALNFNFIANGITALQLLNTGDALVNHNLQVKGSSSGATVISAAATASGTLTLPAATDTLVGKATTDTLTHKTLNGATSGNSVVNLASLKQDATAQLTGNSADQTVWTFSVPGGTIESGTAADFDIWLSHDVGTATITFKLTYGSAVVSCAVGGTAVNEIHLRGMIANNNSVTNAQRLGLDCFTVNTTNAGTATGAVDTTASQTLTFSFNVANTDKITGHSLRVLKF